MKNKQHHDGKVALRGAEIGETAIKVERTGTRAPAPVSGQERRDETDMGQTTVSYKSHTMGRFLKGVITLFRG